MNEWDVWESLCSRFGNPKGASSLSSAQREQVIREQRALRIERHSDGFGSGSVSVIRMPKKPNVDELDNWTSLIDVYFELPAVISDQEMEILERNQWESWNDMPGLP